MTEIVHISSRQFQECKKDYFPVKTNSFVRGNKRITERIYPEVVTADMEEIKCYDGVYYVIRKQKRYLNAKKHLVTISKDNISKLAIPDDQFRHIDKVQVVMKKDKHSYSTFGPVRSQIDTSMEEIVFYKDFDNLYKSLDIPRHSTTGENVIPLKISKGFDGSCVVYEVYFYFTRPFVTIDVSFVSHKR
jgi:hypothetical protein